MGALELPDLGLGVGLRAAHAREILRARPALGFLELLTENHLGEDPRRRALTDELAAAYPVFLHGVSLNIGSVDPLDRAYLREVAALAARSHARIVSDHLCWTGVGGENGHDLYPLPYTEAVLRHVSERVAIAQDLLGRWIAIENPSNYLRFRSCAMSEPEFLARLCEQTGCALLLDVNNVYVGAANGGLDPAEYLAALPADCVAQIHLAGHSRVRGRLIDTHAAPVAGPVWELFASAVQHFGLVSTMVEWDAAIPPFDALYAEVMKAAPIRAAFAARGRRAA
ncbi:MAG: DUF692 domain-containing protein [Deltaproteobacteria bacterium]|nr:MAG: DUF692 domain-containing protein [Deltaproteobacteria bacterium]